MGDAILAWPREPAPVRYYLACLATLYPDIGRHIAADVTAMAEHLGGDADVYVDWLDADNIEAAIRCGQMLVEAAPAAIVIE